MPRCVACSSPWLVSRLRSRGVRVLSTYGKHVTGRRMELFRNAHFNGDDFPRNQWPRLIISVPRALLRGPALPESDFLLRQRQLLFSSFGVMPLTFALAHRNAQRSTASLTRPFVLS